jgi:hypothetical protein
MRLAAARYAGILHGLNVIGVDPEVVRLTAASLRDCGDQTHQATRLDHLAAEHGSRARCRARSEGGEAGSASYEHMFA